MEIDTVVLVGLATTLGTQVLKWVSEFKWFPPNLHNYPRTTAGITAALVTLFVFNQQGALAISNSTEIVATGGAALVVAALTYNNLIRKE